MNIAPCNAHIVILTQQISHYHAARYRAASAQFRKITVFSTSNDADFREFLFDQNNVALYSIEAFYDGYGMYLSAVTSGELWAKVQSRLDQITPDSVAVAGWSFCESLAAIDWAKRNGRAVIMMSESQAIDSRRRGLREFLKKRIDNLFVQD